MTDAEEKSTRTRQQQCKRSRSAEVAYTAGARDREHPTTLCFKKLHERALLPQKGTPGAAGYDLYAVEACVVPAHGKAKVGTGLALAVPCGYYGRIAPRSSMAWKHVDVGAGVIDSDYRGEVGVILYNHAGSDYAVEVGDKVAQLIVERIANPEPIWVDELDASERGAGGFGSTGR